MRLDFSEVKEQKNSTAGMHTLAIIKAEEATSSTGTPMLKLFFKDEEENTVGDNVCLSGGGAFRAKMLFKAIGLDEETAQQMSAGELIGMIVEADVIEEEYEGKIRPKVKKYIG